MAENQVKKIRKSRNISQKDMAIELKMLQSSYSKRESGEIEFKLSELNAIAKILQVPVSELYGGIEPPKIVEEPVLTYKRRRNVPESLSKDGAAVTDYTNRFILVCRRFMAEKRLPIIRDLAQELHIPYSYLNPIMSDHKLLTIKVLGRAVEFGKFNANFILNNEGDYFMGMSGNASQIAEIKANYEHKLNAMKAKLDDKEKLLKSYTLLLKANGVKI